MALITSGAANAARRALAKTLVHRYDRTPITTSEVDGDERPVAGVTTTGVACRYDAAGQSIRDAAGLVVVSVPTLTITHDDPLTVGDRVTNIVDAENVVLVAGPLSVSRRVDSSDLGRALLVVVELVGAEPGRAD